MIPPDERVSQVAEVLTEFFVWERGGQPDMAMHDKTLAMAELAVRIADLVRVPGE